MIECTVCREARGEIAIDNNVEALMCTGCAREELYQRNCRKPSDVNEHMPLLRALASDCDVVIEFGMRWARGSTLAFLAGQPRKLISWDLEPECIVSSRVLDLIRIRGETRFEPRAGDSLEIPPERADLIFFDTFHTKNQLLAELMRHADPVQRLARKYLVFHDTSTYGRIGEDGSTPGIYAAIRHFQRNEAFPLWETMALGQVKGLSAAQRELIGASADRRRDGEPILNLSNNNGLIVLRYICADGHGALSPKGQCTVCGERTR